MIDDKLIEAIIEIGNHKKVIDYCEPQSFYHQELDKYLVMRVLYAKELLRNEWELQQDIGVRCESSNRL